MNNIELVRSAYTLWQEYDEHLLEGISDSDRRLIFLCEQIIGIDTYDPELDIEFGKMILEVMEAIEARTSFEYQKVSHENYKKYILTCNFLKGCLEWGTSIRSAWFNYFDGKIPTTFCLSNIDDYMGDDEIKIDEPFMKWFIKFIKNEEA